MRTERKIWEILSPRYRRMAVGLFVLMLIGMLLEMLGIGLIVPAMAVMTADQAVDKYPGLSSLLARLGNPTQRQLIAGGLLVLLAVYTVKSIFLFFLTWRQAWFVSGVQADVSERLFKTYLAQPWTFHLQRNSAPLIRNCTSESYVFSSVCHSLLTIGTESLILAGIGLLLLLIEPIGTIGVAVILGGATWAFNQLTRQRILLWGTARQHHDGQRYQHLQQGLGGAKDVKMLGREKEFLDIYESHNWASARMAQRQAVMQNLPRLWYELLAIVGLVALGMLMLAQGRNAKELFASLGVFAAAAFRVLPSANRLLLAVQNIRYCLPVTDNLHAELSLPVPQVGAEQAVPISLHAELELRHVSFAYPNAEKSAVKDISLRIPRGASVGLVGGSGAGKSTLVDLILGLLAPTQGAIVVDGIDIRDNLRGWQCQIGYVPQTIFLTDDTIRANIAFGVPPSEIDDAAVVRALKAAQLDEFVQTLPEGAETLVGERGVRLSGGQRQRIGIARALYLDPPVLVLDEATSSLDTDTESGVMEAVNDLHGAKTLIIVAHRLSTVAHCDTLFQLADGKLTRTGTFAEVTQA